MSIDSEEGKHNYPLIFISHPHNYADLATVLRDTIIDWTSGRIQPNQTSDYSVSTKMPPLTIGDNIRDELERTLRETNLILLFFVDAYSANYSMYEAGFARAGGKKPEDTRVIVIQCTSEVPTVFESDLRITLTEASIQQFTRDFHRNPNFFPGLNEPYAPDLPDLHIEEKSKILHKRLMASWQLVQPKLDEPSEVSQRWILFTISIDDTYVNQIYQIIDTDENFNNALDESQKLIEKHCYIQKSDPHFSKHFGLSRVTRDRKFFTCYHRWKKKLERDKKPKLITIDWWAETCKQITYSISALDAEEIVTPFKSAAENKTWYLLVVTCQRTIPIENRTEFDCTLIRLPKNSDYISVKAPD